LRAKSLDWSGFKMTAKSKDFDRLLLNSIDDALLSLGESARQSIYFHIENNFSVPRNQIPNNLQDFQFTLEKIFGVGARFIEILIMKNLYKKIDYPLTMNCNDQLEFIKYTQAAKETFLSHTSD
jgi:hypothetical protein